MKNLLIKSMVLIAFISTNLFAQQAPRSEFSISLSESKLEVKPGESKNLNVTVLRSKINARSSATLGFSSRLPEGITVNFEPSSGLFENSVATFTVAPNAKPGEYTLVLNCSVNHKIKGSVLKFLVSAPAKDAITLN